MEILVKCQESMDALSWCDTSLTLSEFLENNGVPHLVRVKEGYHGVNEASSFEVDQHLLLNTTRTRHTLMGQDSVGRAIVIPLDCENTVLVCALSIEECRQNQIVVADIPELFPKIRYFHVLENRLNEGTHREIKPETILEVQKIDFKNSCVKFEDVDQAVPFSSPVILEPLLDFKEYTLRKAVKYFGLPAKVRFLPTRHNTKKKKKDLNNKFEKLISNLGKVSVLHRAKPEEVVVATKIDVDFLSKGKMSMNCNQIPKDFDLKVCVAKNFENNPSYTNIVKELNKAFLDNYDPNELDNLDKYEYFHFAKEEILCYVLEPTGGEEYENPDKEPAYESIDSGDDYEIVDDHCHANMTSQKLENMTSQEHVTMTSLDHKDDTTREYMTIPDLPTSAVPRNKSSDTNNPAELTAELVRDSNTSQAMAPQDDQCYTMSEYTTIPDRTTPPVSQNNSKVELTTMLKPDRENSLRVSPFPTDMSALSVSKLPLGEDTLTVPVSEYSNSENSVELTTRLKPDRENSLQVSSFPTDMSALSVSKLPFGEDSLTVPVSENSNSENSLELATRLKADRGNSLRVSPIPTDMSAPSVSKPHCDDHEDINSLTVPISTNISALNIANQPGGQDSQEVTIPKDLSALSVTGVGDLLTCLNMDCYVGKFREEQVDGQILVELDETELLSLDLKLFHVKKLMKVVKGWRPNVGRKGC